jgi:hypothetical protein
MKTVHGSGVPGQTSDPSTASTPTPEARTLALLESIDKGIQNLTAQFDVLERRVANIHRDPVSSEPPNATPRPPRIPPLAVRNDGKILLAVTHLEGCDLSGRERWEGVVMNDVEMRYTNEHLADLFDDAAARTAGRFLRKDPKGDTEPKGGGGEEPSP